MQNPLVQEEWKRADEIMRMLDNSDMPHGIVPGNHDIGPGRDYGLYRTYFGADRFEDRPWYGGTYEDNIQHYDLLSAGGGFFRLLTFDVEKDEFTSRTLSAISDETWAYDDALENSRRPSTSTRRRGG